MEIRYNPFFVSLSVLVAIFASYVALNMASSVTQAKKGYARGTWLTCGALAMGFGIWSMHFIGMLALDMPGMSMAYDIPLLVLSIVIPILASALALFIVSRPTVPLASLLLGGVAMAAAISGMHYTGMFSMRMPAKIEWDLSLVTLSIFIALIASFSSLVVSMRMRLVFLVPQQLLASTLMGLAIAGMHYTGMMAATFVHAEPLTSEFSNLLASSTLAMVVIGTTFLILGAALAGSLVERALTRRTVLAEKNAELYKEAQKAVTALNEERELRERFVSALAHDLRNPLGVAIMSTELILDEVAHSNLEILARKAAENLQRVDQMIQDLLDANHISSGQELPLHIEACDLKTLTRKVVDDLTTIHGPRFILESSDDLQEGQWDPKYLRRLIENLCVNAVKYGQAESPVRIQIKNILSETRLAVLLSVHNEGSPLNEDEVRDLFGLFHRGHSANSDKRGWGLGLTIVKGIAEVHGGNVRAESTPEKGTTFFVTLPYRHI